MLKTIEASLNKKAKIEYVEFMEGDVKRILQIYPWQRRN